MQCEKLLTIQYCILTTTSSSSKETERGTWESNYLFTQWACSQTGVWPADLTPRHTHRVKQPRRIKLFWVRFGFLSGTFFCRQELFKKLKRSSFLVFSKVAFCDWVRVRIAQLGIWIKKKDKKEHFAKPQVQRSWNLPAKKKNGCVAIDWQLYPKQYTIDSIGMRPATYGTLKTSVKKQTMIRAIFIRLKLFFLISFFF